MNSKLKEYLEDSLLKIVLDFPYIHFKYIYDEFMNEHVLYIYDTITYKSVEFNTRFNSFFIEFISKFPNETIYYTDSDLKIEKGFEKEYLGIAKQYSSKISSTYIDQLFNKLQLNNLSKSLTEKNHEVILEVKPESTNVIIEESYSLAA